MAAATPVPSSVNIHNMAGVYTLNKKLSSPTDEVLQMQGVGWVVRQAVKWSAVTVTLKQYTDDDQKVHIDMMQVSTGGISSGEERTADWEWREKDDQIFGKVKGRTRFVKLDQIEGNDEYLKEGWEEENLKGEVIENVVKSLTGRWTAHQVWGFAEVEGVRRRVQRVVTGNEGERPFKVRMIYDWKQESE